MEEVEELLAIGFDYVAEKKGIIIVQKTEKIWEHRTHRFSMRQEDSMVRLRSLRGQKWDVLNANYQWLRLRRTS